MNQYGDRKCIGETSAFPIPASEDVQYPATPGMTYRQWLVGQIAGDILQVAIGLRVDQARVDECAKAAIEYADAILARMEKEGK